MQDVLKGCADGPLNFKDLHAWPGRHCQLLWDGAEHGAEYREKFTSLFQSFDVRVYDAYAGTANASSSLKRAMMAACNMAGILPLIASLLF